MLKYMKMTDEQLEQARVNSTTFNTMACIAKELGRRSRLRLNTIRSHNQAKYGDSSGDEFELEIIDTHTDLATDMINNPGYWISVKFDGNSYKNYTYKSVVPVKRGERILVNSPYNGLTAVTAVSGSKPIKFGESTASYKWTLRFPNDPEHARRTEKDKQDKKKFEEDAERARRIAKRVANAKRIVELRREIAKLELETADITD